MSNHSKSDSKKACRQVYSDTLLDLARQDRNIVAVASDSRGSVGMANFAKELPSQFVEAGIAEQNATGIGAGLALCGKKVFVNGPASFYSARSLEQVKVDVAYTGANVKIVGVSGGVSYGALGSTHHSLHDIAVMRTFPGMRVMLPCDNHQAHAMTIHLAESPGPAYIRMGRASVPDVYSESNCPFVPGKANILSEGNDVCIIATGETVWYALQAASVLKVKGISAGVTDMHTIKPLDEEILIMAAKKTGIIVTVEEHHIAGGLGSAVAEVLSLHYPSPVLRLGIPDENVIHANPKEIFRYYKIDSEGIAESVTRFLKNPLVPFSQ